MGARRTGKGGWQQFLKKFESSDGAQKAQLAPWLLDLMRSKGDVPYEALDVIGETALELRRHDGLEATYSFLDEVEKACPELAREEQMHFALIRVENTLAVGESALAVASKAVESWEEDPVEFLKVLECMAWHGSPELKDVLLKIVENHSLGEADSDEDLLLEDEADLSDELDDEDDDLEDEDLDEDDLDDEDDGESDDDDEDLDDEEEVDDDEITLGDLFERIEEHIRETARDWLQGATIHLMAVEAQRVGRTKDVLAAMHPGTNASSKLAKLFDRMVGTPVKELKGTGYLSEDEDPIHVLCDFARYLREHHNWPASRAFLGADAMIDALDKCSNVCVCDPDEKQDKWLLDSEDAVGTLDELLEDDHPHRAAALAAALPVWLEFLQAVGVLTPRKAKQRITNLKTALDSTDIGERILQRVA